jgi:hypothetical protein
MDFKHSRRAFVATGIGAAAWASKTALGAPQDLTTMTLQQASHMVHSKAVSPVDLTQACLPEYAKAVEAAIEVLRKLTASVIELQVPRTVAAPIIWGPENIRVSREVADRIAGEVSGRDAHADDPVQ